MEALVEQRIHKSGSRSTSIFYEQITSPGHHYALGRTNILVWEPTVIHQLSEDAINAISKLQGFAQLAPNWDSYGAAAPTAQVIKRAEKFIREIDKQGITVYFVAPGPNGEILVEFQKGRRSAEVYFHPDQLANFALFEEDELVDEQA